MATFAQQELMKYSETTHHLQHFLNTTCVDILWAQSPQTGACQAQWGAGGGVPAPGPHPLGIGVTYHCCFLQGSTEAAHTPHWCWV